MLVSNLHWEQDQVSLRHFHLPSYSVLNELFSHVINVAPGGICASPASEWAGPLDISQRRKLNNNILLSGGKRPPNFYLAQQHIQREPFVGRRASSCSCCWRLGGGRRPSGAESRWRITDLPFNPLRCSAGCPLSQGRPPSWRSGALASRFLLLLLCSSSARPPLSLMSSPSRLSSLVL